MKNYTMILERFKINNTKINILKLSIMLIMLVSLMVGIALTSYSDDINQGLSDNLIRLHVVANSNLEEDQNLKYEVRDIVIKYMQEITKEAKTKQEAKQLLINNASEINKLVENYIKENNKDFEVNTEFGVYPFPSKKYEDIILPSGSYEALKITIGQGIGENWWCVLFPPLCFINSTDGVLPESVKNNLKNTLTEEEFNIITSVSNSEDIPIQIKFKIVDVFQGSRIKIAGVINRILGA